MPTNLYGPGDNYHLNNSHVLPALIRRFHEASVKQVDTVTCWGTGNPRREFLHVDDLGSACVFALENWRPTSTEVKHLNVGSGIDLSIRELADLVSHKIGFMGNIEWDTSKPDGTPRKLLDVSKMSNLGWTATISLQHGLSDTIKQYREDLAQNLVRI